MARELNLPAGIHRMTRWLIKAAGLGVAAVAVSVNAEQTDIPGPAGSGAFGTTVTVLPNGNIVVTDPNGPVSNVGAVYLYSPTGVLISSFTGSSANDQVGRGGVTVLRNGNYVVRSPNWDNGFNADAGAVTWANGNTGLSGLVSPANSLIGTTTGDQVGDFGVTALGNGNYVVTSSTWSNGANSSVGAVTWANGNTGLSGTVSPANSLIGATAYNRVGFGGVTALTNGNYVVRSIAWSDGSATNLGAVTWANGSTGLSGVVSPANSLVGTTAYDGVGSGGVTALSNGNYVVGSYLWDNGAAADAGAATWADGSTGLSGAVSPANSLIGTATSDLVGFGGVTALSNGNYVVISSFWDNGASADVGAVTWADGSTGFSSAVSPANSLIGTATNDRIGFGGVTALSNANYVVISPTWDNGATADVGAVTWADGNAGFSGAVSPVNSLIGTTTGDQIGSSGAINAPGVTALGNGNYVVRSPGWDNGASANVGAVTWADGGTGLSGVVSPANSLIGTTTSDFVGNFGVAALSNGNYVVASPSWDDGTTVNAGAVTWADGTMGLSGVVTTANSLIGATTNNSVGSGRVTALRNGNYAVRSPNWDNGASMNAGAVTWANGSTGLSGLVSSANSLVGTTTSDQVGDLGVTALGDGNYVVGSSSWDNGATADAGAVTLALGDSGLIGDVLAANSVRGTVAGGGSSMVFAYDPAREQLVVGRPASNIVSLFRLSSDLIFKNGFE